MTYAMVTSTVRNPLLRQLIEIQGNRCAGCGQRMAPRGDACWPQNLPSIDHVWPRSTGGGDHLGNMLAMHRRCNSAKGNRPPTGCELILHQMVLAQLGLHPADRIIADLPNPTLGDLWPGIAA